MIFQAGIQPCQIKMPCRFSAEIMTFEILSASDTIHAYMYTHAHMHAGTGTHTHTRTHVYMSTY